MSRPGSVWVDHLVGLLLGTLGARSSAGSVPGGVRRARRGVSTLYTWLCLLCLATGATPALAAPSLKCLPADRAFTVASGQVYGVDLSDCSPAGLKDNGATAQHGTISGLLMNSTGKATYTNNGDGATSDYFTLQDEDSRDVNFIVTIMPAVSPISVLPESLSAPAIGVAYSVNMTASGGVGPYTYALASGTLPTGLTLGSNGLISGTPTSNGTFNFAVLVRDSTPSTALTSSKNYAFTVAIPQLTIAQGEPPGVVSTPYNYQFSTTGGTAPYTYVIESGVTPTGLSLSNSGLLFGTPSGSGDYTFSVKATDSTGGGGPFSTSRNVQLRINAVAPPVTGAVSVSLEANTSNNPIMLNFSGGAATSVAVSTAASHGTATASGTTISYTPDAGYRGPDSLAYTATNAGGTSAPATVTLDVVGVPDAPTIGTATAGNNSASVSFTPPVNNGGSVISSYTATASPGGLSGTSTGSPVTVTGLTNGTTYTFTVVAINAKGTSTSSTASNTVTPGVAPPTITAISPSSGPKAGGSNVIISGSGFTAASSVLFGTSPANSFFVTSDSQISTSSPAGTGTVAISVVTPGGTSATTSVSQFTYSDLTVSPVSATVAYNSANNPISLVINGTADSVKVATQAINGTATADGTGITYTPTAGYAGNDTFTYNATNGAGTSATATVSVNVSTPLLTVTASGPWSANSGQPYTQTLTWSGGAAPYSSYTVTGLPAGLTGSTTTDNSLTLSGTPTQPGSFTVMGSAVDSSTGIGPFTVSQHFTLTVGAAPALVLTPGPTTFAATLGSAFSQVFTASGGVAPYTFTQTGTLPAGVSWNATTATLSGTPAAGGSFAFAIQVSDSNSGAPATTSQNYSLQVANLVPVAPTLSVASAGPGEPVEVDLTASATGGPFIGAHVVSVTPASAGSAAISAVAGGGFRLRFVPNPDASGAASVIYTLSNASSTSSPGVVNIALTSRGDPAKDAEVQGVLNAQANSSRRFASGQISNFQQRLEALHSGNVSAFSNGFTLSSASLQRQRLRQNQNDDPTGIEQWMQIQSAKLRSDQSLRARTLSQQAQALKPVSATAQGPELGNQSASAATSPLAFWTSGTISIGDDSRGSSAQKQEFVTSGLSVGADYRLAQNLTVGLGFGYGHDKTDIGDNGSRSLADSYSVAVYGSYRPLQSIYLDAVLGYQRLSFDNRRYVTDNGSLVNGDRDGGQTFASLAAGYEYREDNWLVSPYARLDLAHAKLDSYRERGDNLYALYYEQQTVKTTSTSLGLRGEFTQSTHIGELTPSLRLEYQHDFQGSGDAAMRYANSGNGALYRSSLDPQGQDRGVFGLGLGLLTEAQWAVNMEYQYTLSSGSQTAQTLLFSLRKPF